FQAEDGIRDRNVTGVQTCALPILRESAVFSGISLTERVSERSCGVWVVDIRSGKTVAYLKFEDAVQEVFAVQVLPGMRFPDVLRSEERRVGEVLRRCGCVLSSSRA